MNNKLIHNGYLNLVVRLLLGGLFIFTALSKFSDLSVFSKEIDNYNILPIFLINTFAVVLPWVELLCGIFLLTGIRIKANAMISISLFSVFTLAILIAMFQGLSINCGCHTKLLADKVGITKVLQNMGFLVLSVFLFYFPGNKFSFESLIKKTENDSTV
ncbi:MAG: DoxX family membrane protein [Bacteroidetes bacterium]|nr:DoxX family membrane protein [Bacteroidota bacterium]